MEFSAADVALLLGGVVEGDASVKVNTLAKIQEGFTGAISFLANLKYESYLYETNSSIVLVNSDFVPRAAVKATMIKVPDAYSAFTSLLEQYHKIMLLSKVGVEEPSFIHESAQVGDSIYRGAFSYIGANTVIGNNTKIYPQVYIGENVTIGDNTVIYPGARIYQGCVIGNNCVIHGGAVIGADGFGFAPQADGSYKSIPQLGNVVIGDFVDIGANTTIDRATMGSTIIESGVKLDNLVQIAHNVTIHSHTVIAAQAGIAGSATIGAHNMIGGQVGIVGHITLADKTSIQAQSGVAATIEKSGTAWQGSPAEPIRNHLRNQVIFRKLPELEARVRKLERGV